MSPTFEHPDPLLVDLLTPERHPATESLSSIQPQNQWCRRPIPTSAGEAFAELQGALLADPDVNRTLASTRQAVEAVPGRESTWRVRRQTNPFARLACVP